VDPGSGIMNFVSMKIQLFPSDKLGWDHPNLTRGRYGQQSIRIDDGQAIFFSGARGYLHNVFIARQIIYGSVPRKIRLENLVKIYPNAA
jgi:hypothetical protein